APVVDQFGRPAGVVTRDACAAWKEFSVRSSQHSFASDEFDQSTVQQIMRPVVEIIHEHDCSRDVIEKLVEQRIRRAYVVNDEGELVGVLSMADVLRHLLASDTSRQASSADASLLY